MCIRDRHAALDELVGLEGLLGLLGDGVGDIGLADQHDGVEVMREGAELANLLAGECHVSTRFLRGCFLQVNDTAPQARGQGTGPGAAPPSTRRPWPVGRRLVTSCVSICSSGMGCGRAR